MWVFLVIGFAAAALGFLPSAAVSLSEGKELLGEWSVLIMIGLWIRNRWVRRFFWWAVLGYIFNYTSATQNTLRLMAFYFVAYEILSRGLKREHVNYLLNTMRSVALVQVGMMFLQAIGYDPIFSQLGPGDPHVGFLGNTVHAGAFLAILLPLFAVSRWKWCIPVLVIAIVLSKSAGAFGIALILSIFLFIKNPAGLMIPFYLTALVMGAAIFTGAVTPVSEKIRIEKNNRLLVWKDSVRLVPHTKETLIRGWGAGQYKIIYRGAARLDHPGEGWRLWLRAHNEPIQILFEHGVVGLIFFIMIVFSFYRSSWGSRDPPTVYLTYCLTSYLLVCLYSFPLRIASLGMTGLVIVSCLQALLYSTKRYPTKT